MTKHPIQLNPLSDHTSYLTSSDVIDWQHPDVSAKARELTKGMQSTEEKTKACFTFVRDEIRHSLDYKLSIITCKASEVLEHTSGYCYAKSHLLAALLRANQIPAGLCYQRLTIDNDEPPFCLHGLNAVFLKDYGWYRVDARGNKAGVSAEFTPPLEHLAFPVKHPGEADFPDIHVQPLDQIVKGLANATDVAWLADNLPDRLPDS